MKVLYEIWRMPLGPPILGNSQSYLDQLNRSSIAWYICMIRRISFNVSFTGLGLPHLPRLGPGYIPLPLCTYSYLHLLMVSLNIAYVRATASPRTLASEKSKLFQVLRWEASVDRPRRSRRSSRKSRHRRCPRWTRTCGVRWSWLTATVVVVAAAVATLLPYSFSWWTIRARTAAGRCRKTRQSSL